MAEVIFFIAAIAAIAGAVGTVALRNPFFAVLAVLAGIWCYARTGFSTDPDALLSALGDGGRSAITWLTEVGS